jgi:chemotaxis protein methyltransferase CheR
VPDYAALTEDEYRRLCEFIYRRTGMVFTEAKRYYVERRVVERMLATESRSFESYFARLRAGPPAEIEQFVNAFTVNETYFYREEHQLSCLTADLLAARLKATTRGDQIRIWSVPCSTGEEPYSIAIWLLENWPLVDRYDIEIVGSDIDTGAVGLARAGIYGKRALMRLPPHLVDKYFEPAGDETWRIIDDLRQSVRFTAANIVNPAETTLHGQFDVIFCRNVLIYFDQDTKVNVFNRLAKIIEPDGFLVLGAAETVVGLSAGFSPYPERRGLYHPSKAASPSIVPAGGSGRLAVAAR